MKRKMTVSGGLWMMIAALTIGVNDVPAQVILTGTSYRQTFDDLASGLPAGWSVRTNATSTALGIEAALVTNTVSWSSSSGQFANFASTIANDGTEFVGTEASGVQAGATNRCLALRQTSGFGDPGAAFVLQLENTIGLSGFQLALDLNLLSVQGRSTIWTVDYAIGDDPAVFVPMETHLDPGAFGSTEKTIQFGNALDNQAENVWIRLVALTGSTGSGSRDTFGIDNVVLTWQPLPAAPTAPLLNIQVIGTNAVLTWTNAGFVLEAADFPNGEFAPMNGISSPHTNPINGDMRFFRLRAQ